MDQFIDSSVALTLEAIRRIDSDAIAVIDDGLNVLKRRDGRLFIVGPRDDAGYASHAVNDFRNIVDPVDYAPTDNVSELTARITPTGGKEGHLLCPESTNCARSADPGDNPRGLASGRSVLTRLSVIPPSASAAMD